MSEPIFSPALTTEQVEQSSHLRSIITWGTEMEVAVCEHCHCRYLLQSGKKAPTCPNCCGAKLTVLPGGLPDILQAPPELILPCSVSDSALRQSLQTFCAGIPLAPQELSPSRLAARMNKLYLPMWLVDANVYAFWQAEAGFDYQVISHQETFDENQQGWQSKEIKEERVRWENRVGRLKRVYQNIPVHAIEDAARLETQIGPFQQEDARTYHPEELGEGIVRLPEITRNDSWKEAAAALQKAAALECRQACGANRLREFRWKAQFARQNWTLMLMPVYATRYQDDDGRTYPVLIHGQTGKVYGQRRASIKRAIRESLFVFGAGLIILLIGLLMAFVFPETNRVIAAVANYVVLLGFVFLLASSAPYIIAWDFNHKQKPVD